VVAAWAARGEIRRLAGLDIFTVDIPPAGPESAEPLLVLHGFPTSSFDFRHVVDDLARRRRVVLLDLAGYGLSAKPDRPYTMELQADVVAAFTAGLGLDRLALLTHDMGDTVGGELLARQLEGTWPVEVTRRVLTNGSIYIGLAQLSVGQEVLLALPDQALTGAGLIDGPGMAANLAATFSPASAVDGRELDAQWELISRAGGHLLLPRLIRYVEERRRSEDRYTGAIENHPSPLAVVWGVDDPIAVVSMTDRLLEARPDASVTLLGGVGHFPMIEAPGRFLAAVTPALAGPSPAGP
jgi:pimeloyl-ACP methyl ester carboxylesterase